MTNSHDLIRYKYTNNPETTLLSLQELETVYIFRIALTMSSLERDSKTQ